MDRSQEKKLGRYTHTIVPWGYRQRVRTALAHAEAMFGRPVYVHEIYYEIPQVTWYPSLSPYITWQACLDLYQNDEILADRLCDQFSVNKSLQRSYDNPKSEYELFSDRFMRRWPSYQLDENLIVRPTIETPRINFNTLKKLLMSPVNEENLLEYEAMVAGEPKFLDGTCSMFGSRVAFASYPRSGNSFLRRMIE